MTNDRDSSIENQHATMRSLTFVWFALVGSLVLLSGVTYFITIPSALQENEDPLNTSLYYTLSIALTLMGMLGSVVLYKIKVSTSSRISTPSKETLLKQYQGAFLQRIALLEAPGVFSIVAAIATQQFYFAVITGAIVILMVIAKPTELQFREDFLNGRNL